MSPRLASKLALAAAGALLAVSAFGQARGGGSPAGGIGGGGGSTGGTSIGRSPSTTSIPNTTNPNNNSTQPNITRPIFLNGRVVVDDGSPLPEPATIVRVCNGSPHNAGYTDAKGMFSIQLFNESGVTQDANESGYGAGGAVDGVGGMGSGNMQNGSGNAMAGMQRRMSNCELKANLSGYRSQSVALSPLQPMDGPTDIGAILLHRNSKTDEGNTVSATSLAAPKDARKAFEKGVSLARKDKTDDAFQSYQKAVMLYPAYAEAWCELGKIEAARGQVDVARGSFTQAVKSDPKFVVPYLELSRIALNAKNWPELAHLTGKAIDLDSFDYPQEFLFDAVAHYNLHEFELAEKSVTRAETLDTRHEFPQIVYLKGLVQVQHKDYTAAADSLRAYLKLAPSAEDAGNARHLLAEVEKYTASRAAAGPGQPR